MNTVKEQAYDFLTNDDYNITKDDLITHIFNFFNSDQCVAFVEHIKKELDIDETVDEDNGTDDEHCLRSDHY